MARKTKAPKYQIQFSKAALEDIVALPKGDRNALRKEIIEKLANAPKAYSRPLRDPLGGFWSFHWRELRVVFRILTKTSTVAIVGVGGHSDSARQDIYRRLESYVSTAKTIESALASLRSFKK